MCAGAKCNKLTFCEFHQCIGDWRIMVVLVSRCRVLGHEECTPERQCRACIYMRYTLASWINFLSHRVRVLLRNNFVSPCIWSSKPSEGCTIWSHKAKLDMLLQPWLVQGLVNTRSLNHECLLFLLFRIYLYLYYYL